MWYSPQQTLSHNCLLNFVVSSRGAGKTFSALKFCIEKYLDTGAQFIYLRRTKEELKKIQGTILAALTAEDIFGDYMLSERGENLQIARHGKPSEIMGWSIALSTAHQLKSAAYPNVKYVIFDEFLIEDMTNCRYLKNEVQLLLGFMETVFRMRNVRILCLGNYVSNNNPYFDFFKIYPKIGSTFTKDRKRGILVHMYKNDEYIKAKKNTAFAKLIDGTDYARYMIDNEALINSNSFIRKPSGKTFEKYILSNCGELYAIHEEAATGLLYVMECQKTSIKICYAMDMQENPDFRGTVQAQKNHSIFKRLDYAMTINCCFFENARIRDMILTHLKYI